MAVNRHKYNWFVDVFLLILFLAAFELDVTGLALHQWLGIAAGVLAAYHLLLHWNWMKTITRRFSSCSSWQTRVCYLVDAALMAGFLLMIGSGLLISTWLNLTFEDYFLWRDLHVSFSILTLLLTALKMILHWRWMVSVTRQHIFKRSVKPLVAHGYIIQSAPKPAVSRGDFLRMLAAVTAGTAVVLLSALHEDTFEKDAPGSPLHPGEEILESNSQISSVKDMQPVAQDDPVVMDTPAAAEEAVPVDAGNMPVDLSGSSSPAAVTSTPVQMPTQAAPQAEVEPVAASALLCNRACRKNKHCSYPGDCRQYVDTNNNQLCDLGECV